MFPAGVFFPTFYLCVFARRLHLDLPRACTHRPVWCEVHCAWHKNVHIFSKAWHFLRPDVKQSNEEKRTVFESFPFSWKCLDNWVVFVFRQSPGARALVRNGLFCTVNNSPRWVGVVYAGKRTHGEVKCSRKNAAHMMTPLLTKL